MTTKTLYHGTTSEKAESILQHGLQVNSYLTSREDVAAYYAEVAVDVAIDNGSEPDEVILKVTVNCDDLRVDYPAYEEPLTCYRNEHAPDDEAWYEGIESGDIPSPKDEYDIDTALNVTSCVKTAVAISSTAIAVHE